MSTHHHHTVVWIDHREARVFHLSPTDADKLVLRPDNPAKQIHHKANAVGSGHAAEDQNYLQAVTEAVADAGAVLIAGPAHTKTELVKHIQQRDPKLASRIAGVETVDHPSDAALVAHARKYFRAADRMTQQKI